MRRHRGNGCETNLTSTKHCGICGNDCASLPHVASASCSNGGCVISSCADSWTDSDHNVQNGCEMEPGGLTGTTLVINEIDYDQVGTDVAEFVEIYKPTPYPIDLTDMALVFVNGGTNTEYGRVSLAAPESWTPASTWWSRAPT